MSFDPSQLPGLLAWFKSGVGTTLSTSATQTFPALAPPADGASIGSWNDNSGLNTTIFSQATVADQPTYKASGVGLPGHPCLVFANANTPVTGAGAWMAERAANLYTPLTGSNSVIMLVYEINQGHGSYQILFTNSEGGSGTELLIDLNGVQRYNSGAAGPTLAAGAVSMAAYTYNTTGNVEKSTSTAQRLRRRLRARAGRPCCRMRFRSAARTAKRPTSSSTS